MKIIDKTPLLDEKGNLGFTQRVQGMLQFGFNWPRELEAQSAIIKFFDRQLEKGYTLIRNMTLGQSGIMIPMILLGPSGIYVIEVTHLRGRYEARAEAWNVESGDSYKPAPVNLIHRTQRMANALQKFIERQGVRIPVTIEPVIIAGNPGLHIESVRPAIKVMMIDGIKAFVNGLINASPILNSMQVNEFADRIINPRPKLDLSAPPPEPESEPEPRAAWQEMYSWQEQPTQPPASQPPLQEDSRARAIFDAAEEAPPFTMEGFDFAMAEQEAHAPEHVPPFVPESGSEQPLPQAKPKQQRILGMTPAQIAILAGLALLLFCILAMFAYVVFF
jgi:hypothetical protein